MTLQPLVENSLNHGIDSYPTGGVIKIYIETTDQHLFIHVMDNGRGMKPEQLAKINNSLQNGQSPTQIPTNPPAWLSSTWTTVYQAVLWRPIRAAHIQHPQCGHRCRGGASGQSKLLTSSKQFLAEQIKGNILSRVGLIPKRYIKTIAAHIALLQVRADEEYPLFFALHCDIIHSTSFLHTESKQE